MYTFKHSVFINRPVQEVWEFVSDLTNHPQFGSMATVERSSDGPPGVGSTYRSVSRFLGRTIESTSETTGWEPPNKFSSKSVEGPIAFQDQWEFADEDSGTLVTLSGEAEMGGFFKIAEGIVGKQIDKQITTDLGALKLMLETDAA
ncbi:MAG: SRPBCC family protein [Anaerolineae bacterium]